VTSRTDEISHEQAHDAERVAVSTAEFQAAAKTVSADAELNRTAQVVRSKSDIPPAVRLEDYFERNTQQDSIALNQVGSMRRKGRSKISRGSALR
jgi:hypothetical protein